MDILVTLPSRQLLLIKHSIIVLLGMYSYSKPMPHIRGKHILLPTFIVFFFLFINSFVAHARKQAGASNSTFIAAQDARICYEGRISVIPYNTQLQTPAMALSWPGSSATLSCKAKYIAAKMADDKGLNYYYILIDGKVHQKIAIDTQLKTYELARFNDNKTHKITLYKLTEARGGTTYISGFDVDGTIITTPQPKKRIEIYGNSITSGYSVDDTVGDSGSPEYFNNYFAYGALLGRNYKASVTHISKSGIGLMVSWFPLIMPEMYHRISEQDSLHSWDFTSSTPNLVIINLGQNDSWLINKPDHEQFKYRFGNKTPDDNDIINAYKNFISTIRRHYPQTPIVCMMGNMDVTKQGSKWPDLMQKAVEALHASDIYVYIHPYKGSAGHPKRPQQAQLANGLIRFLDNKVHW